MTEQNPSSKMGDWLKDERAQAILRAQRAVAFEFDLATKKQVTSLFISEYIAGNFDGRLLSVVMLEDKIVHPEDVEKSTKLRDTILMGEGGEAILRLLTPSGEYSWFRMTITPCPTVKDNYFVGVIVDINDEMFQKEVLRHRAQFDSVSGVYNKATFFERMQHLLLAEPDRLRYLVRFDINRFKIINQAYSVSEGDLVLHHVGKILRELATSDECYARMGNDVFCVCLVRPEEEVFQFLNELEKGVNTYPLAFQFYMNFGILKIDHYEGEPVNILCDRAALAQSQVKGSYIQQYAFYDSSMSVALNREHYITGYMSKALHEGQFHVFLQPKVDMQTGRIIGSEALARWMHPIDGLISPAEFIPLFERNGFILRLDQYIWELACQTLRKWLDEGIDPPPISVNVSRMHLYDSTFCDRLLNLVEKYRILPQLLELEITESAYTESHESLYHVMDKLQEKGFVFEMDDFGSGYSSLNALKDIPVNVVKIDLHFLQEARRGLELGRGILKGTLQLIRELNLPVVVEGVETQEQADFLLSVGCVYAQGFHYARPMPVAQFERFLVDAGGFTKRSSTAQN